LKVGKNREKKERKYQVINCAKNRKYGKKKRGDTELTSGMTKLMAISTQMEEEIEGSKNRWRRSLLEFLSFSNNATTRKVGLRMQNDKMEEEYQRRKSLLYP